MQEWIKYFQLNFKQYHTSDHAPRSDLRLIVYAISPKLLIPVHSEHRELYKEILDIPILLPKYGRYITV